MLKKILVFFMIFSFMVSQSFIGGALCDDGYMADFLKQTVTKEKPVSQDEGYEKLTCPSCGRDFEILMDPNDLEYKKGIKKVTCPYDGTGFYPKPYSEQTRELQYEMVRCPDCGREFKAYIDVKALLAGRPQVITCPYDKKKFHFRAESARAERLKWANIYTVRCPTGKRTFKAYVDPENLKEVTCPYDGTKFFPTPDSIVFEKQYEVGGPDINGIPTVVSDPIQDLGYNIRGQGGMLGGASYRTQENIYIEKPSQIETMFSETIPLSVSKGIQQFGYDIFKPVQPGALSSDRKDGQEGAGGEESGKLLKTLLGAGKDTGIIKKEVSVEEGFSAFSAPAEIPVINDYVLGPGDMLRISIWGQIQETFPVTVDAEGKILLPKIGPIYLWGVKFGDAEKMIKDSMLKGYTNIQISVSMGKLRNIKVFVLGEINKPGAYNISALSNSFHALYAAGGPTKLGSLRNMKLIRKGSPEQVIDLYNILLRGDNTQDYKLQANDTVFVPSIGDVVGVAGNVKRPAIYELNGKAKLSEVIEMAGGFSSVGYLHRMQIERVQEHLRKVVLDLEFKSFSDLQNSEKNLDMQDGDLILIFPITPVRYNFVSITGNILRPGDYELKAGMRLKDMIDKAGGMLPGTYLKRAEISRFRGDKTREIIPVDLTDLMDGKEDANITLKEWDLVTVYSRKEVMPEMFVEIDGAVGKPGRYELSEKMKVSDLIFRAGGLKPDASLKNAELYRKFAGADSRIISIDLEKALGRDLADARGNDVILETEDQLFVREDITKQGKFIVTLSGEFAYPGKYAVEKGARLSEVISRAGGFTKSAYVNGCVYSRKSVQAAQEKMVKHFLESEQKALLQEQSSLAVGMTPVQAESRNKLLEYRKNLMEQLQKAQLPGRVLIRLNSDISKFENSEYNIVVEDRDTLYAPARPSTVQVVGNVFGAGAITFSRGKGVDYYINKVGGLTKYADARRIFVIRANGETISSFVRAVKIMPGDVIAVPEEFKYRTLPGLVLKDIVQVIYQATLGAAVTITAVNTL